MTHHRIRDPDAVDTDVRDDERTVPTDEGDHEQFCHYVAKDKLTEAMVMGTPVIALCGKVWVPSRAPEKFPVCPDCKEIWESMKRRRRRRPGLRRVTGRPTDAAVRSAPSPHPGLAGARGLGHGAAAAGLADGGDRATTSSAPRATSSPSRRRAPARPPSR